jgi:hypothetical protein
MGMFARILTAAAGAKLLHGAVSRPTQSGQYIPATQADPAPGTIASRANDIVGRAKAFYAENPKLVHTVGTAALAIALASFAKRRGLL